MDLARQPSAGAGLLQAAIEHFLKRFPMQHPDGYLCLLTARDVVYDVDIVIVRVLPGCLHLPIFERDGRASGRSPECLDLDLAWWAGYVVRQATKVDIFGLPPGGHAPEP